MSSFNIIITIALKLIDKWGTIKQMTLTQISCHKLKVQKHFHVVLLILIIIIESLTENDTNKIKLRLSSFYICITIALKPIDK